MLNHRVSIVVCILLSLVFAAFSEEASVDVSPASEVKTAEGSNGGILAVIGPIITQMQNLNPLQLGALLTLDMLVTDPEQESNLANFLGQSTKHAPTEAARETIIESLLPIVAIPSQLLSQLRGSLTPNRRALSSTDDETPVVDSVPSVPSVPSVASVPSVPSVPSVASVPSVPSVASVPSVPTEARDPRSDNEGRSAPHRRVFFGGRPGYGGYGGGWDVEFDVGSFWDAGWGANPYMPGANPYMPGNGGRGGYGGYGGYGANAGYGAYGGYGGYPYY